MELLGEMPKDTLDGVGVGTRTQLQQLVVIDEAIFTHKTPPSESLSLYIALNVREVKWVEEGGTNKCCPEKTAEVAGYQLKHRGALNVYFNCQFFLCAVLTLGHFLGGNKPLNCCIIPDNPFIVY